MFAKGIGLLGFVNISWHGNLIGECAQGFPVILLFLVFCFFFFFGFDPQNTFFEDHVDFFGQKAATATGPAVFAMRTGAAIIPMFILRQENDQHKIVIEPPVPLEGREDEKETIAATMTKITNLIEQYIRCHPHEWAWMHRRWKSRPKGQ